MPPPIQKYRCCCCEELYATKQEADFCCDGKPSKIVYLCPICEDEYETEEEAKDCACHYRETVVHCTSCDEYALKSDCDDQPKEIYEWYFVDSFLCNELAKRGYPVIPEYNIWGRTCTGQAIYMDGIIERIATDCKFISVSDTDVA